MRTLLVTGFGAFPGVPENPSGAVARLLDGTVRGDVRIVGREIETSWARAWPALAEAARVEAPDALVMLGVSARAVLQIELTARNLCNARVDCDGCEPDAAALVADGPAMLPTTLPWQALDAATSDDAGGYLCNAVFYLAQHHLHTIPLRGFVHLPKAGADDAQQLILQLADWMTAQ
ncbi:MAG: pyroglutamyl-peptidase [Bradymonadia bacterium]|jgi:pyroglutamyl-peptidase